MARTSFTGPLASGTKEAGISGGSNVGLAQLSQSILVSRDATLVQSGSINLPSGSQIVSVIPDVLTAYDSATSATLTVGIAAAGTEYVSGVNAKTGGRAAPTISAAQATNMGDISTNTTVTATVTSVGQPTVGSVRVIVNYIQKDGA